jgi:hypothetical protein
MEEKSAPTIDISTYTSQMLKDKGSNLRKDPVVPGEFVFDYYGDFIGVLVGYSDGFGNVSMPDDIMWVKK